MICADCKKRIEWPHYAVLWGHSDLPMTVAFVCLRCANNPKYHDISDQFTNCPQGGSRHIEIK